MTVDDIRARVARIQERACDDEAAHIAEDRLREDVLLYLAEQGNELAREALESTKIDFARWCA